MSEQQHDDVGEIIESMADRIGAVGRFYDVYYGNSKESHTDLDVDDWMAPVIASYGKVCLEFHNVTNGKRAHATWIDQSPVFDGFTDDHFTTSGEHAADAIQRMVETEDILVEPVLREKTHFYGDPQ